MLRGMYFIFWTAIAILLLAASDAGARPAHRRALADYFGPFLPKKLNDCRTCHLPDRPGMAPDQLATEKPHNAFGARLKEVKKELRKAGKKFDIPSRLEAVFYEDSDGDGISNLVELLTGHFPGDPNDKPTAAELAEAPKLLAAFEKARKAYRWAPFETVKRPAPPGVRNAAWVRNPIDAFIAGEHESHGLSPRPEASKAVLLRRVYLDLIGIPPTRAELHAFLTDTSSDSYERVVDSLLASPRYGERWGRHWMDVWRYSDWAGFGEEVRESQKHIWHWRDWIIESLNNDKGYDCMIQEMLAADELAPTDSNAIRATGFLVRNWFSFNRQVWLDNTVEHTSKAFLGITLNCARCHDHMFDPMVQSEYYAFRAFFEPHQVRTDRVPGQPDINKDGIPRVYDKELTTPTFLFIRGNDANPDKSKAIAPAVPALFTGAEVSIHPIHLPPLAYDPDKRDFVIQETIRASAQNFINFKNILATTRQKIAGVKQIQQSVREGEVEIRMAEMNLAVAEAAHAELLAVVRAERLEDAGVQHKDPNTWKKAALEANTAQRQKMLTEAQRDFFKAQRTVPRARANVAHLLAAKLLPAQGQTVAASAARAAVEIGAADVIAAQIHLAAPARALAKAEQEARKPATTTYVKRNLPTYPASSSGRRLALARWITDKQNPLAARVAMNHIWLRHFGKAIVPTVFDFGRNGQPASHPALLDWLADEFMRNGWSMKSMHRLIVLCNTYRMESTPDPANLALDPDNRYVWRMSPRRLEAESVRDSVLHVAGQLDSTMNGPDIDYRLGLTTPRRSVYFRHAAEKEMEFLALFDAANVTECYARSESIIPQQALALSNSSLVVAQSRHLARRLLKEFGEQANATTTAAFVRASFEEVLSRAPTAQEQTECCRFLEDQTALLRNQKPLTPFTSGVRVPLPPASDPYLRALEDLVQVLMNHNDFVTIR